MKLTAELIGTRQDAYGTTETYAVGEYEVSRKVGYSRDGQRMAWLCIRCFNDKLHDWRDMQTIKNVLCGEECQAVEIYPAESELIDTANNFHLWVFLDGYKLPFGFRGYRAIHDPSIGNVQGMTPQRPFDEVPADATDYLSASLPNLAYDRERAPILPSTPKHRAARRRKLARKGKR